MVMVRVSEWDSGEGGRQSPQPRRAALLSVYVYVTVGLPTHVCCGCNRSHS